MLTVFLIVNAALGAGLLNFPRAFADAGGVAEGTAVQGAFMVFILGALLVLAHCADMVWTRFYLFIYLFIYLFLHAGN